MNNPTKTAQNLGVAAALASSSLLAPLKTAAADSVTSGVSANQPVTVTAVAPRFIFEGKAFRGTLQISCNPSSLVNKVPSPRDQELGGYDDIGTGTFTVTDGTNTAVYPFSHPHMYITLKWSNTSTNQLELGGELGPPVSSDWPTNQWPFIDGAGIRTFFPDEALTNTSADNLLKLEQGRTVFPAELIEYPATVTVTVPQSPSVEVPQLSKLPDNRLSVAWKDPTLRLQRSDSITGTYADVLVDGTNAVSPYIEDMATGGPARLSELPGAPTAGKKGVVVPPKQRQGFFRLQPRATDELSR